MRGELERRGGHRRRRGGIHHDSAEEEAAAWTAPLLSQGAPALATQPPGGEEGLSAGWVVCDHDGAPVSREVRHDVVCATCGVASVMVMRGSGRLSKIEYLFFIFVSCEG